MNEIERAVALIEDYLKTVLPECSGELENIPGMLDYSLAGGGKRVRPVLCIEFCRALGGDENAALAPAAALEYVHTYSLIHDDLPCMDNDDYRRGKLSSHKKFGEANALLAGDALLTHAFGIIAQGCRRGLLSAEKAIDCIGELSENAGVNGMIGGQYLDLKYENAAVSGDTVFLTDALKTSALIICACRMGVIAAGGEEKYLAAAKEFGLKLGLAFQIKDDIIEYDEGDTSDTDNGKSTYISLFGYEKAAALVEKYTAEAVAALDVFGERADVIKGIADALGRRNH